MAKKTYFTKADLMDFAEHITSDERRERLRKDAERKFREGVRDVKPWTTLARIVTGEDFRNWKTKRENEEKN